MFNKKYLCATAIAISSTTSVSPVMAGQEQGDMAINIAGTLINTEESDVLFAFSDMLYALTDRVQLGGTVLVTGSDDSTTGSFGVKTRFNFSSGDSDIIPYVGANVTFGFGDIEEDRFGFGFGLKNYISEDVNVFLDVSFSDLLEEEENEFTGEVRDASQVISTIGVEFEF